MEAVNSTESLTAEIALQGLVQDDLSSLPEIARRHGVALLVLFGSTARGLHRTGSDLDLGVLFTSAQSDDEWHAVEQALHFALEDALEPACELQLVTLNRADEALCKEVADHGLVLYADDSDRWVLFRIQAYRAYELAARFRHRSWNSILRKYGLQPDERSATSETNAA